MEKKAVAIPRNKKHIRWKKAIVIYMSDASGNPVFSL